MQKPQGITRIIKAFGYSIAGLRAAFISEAAFRQELLLALLAVPFIIFIDVTRLEKALMGGCIILIFIAELINTALEAVIDRISEAKHPLSKKVKDVGSAIVLLAFVNLIYVWCVVLI